MKTDTPAADATTEKKPALSGVEMELAEAKSLNQALEQKITAAGIAVQKEQYKLALEILGL